MRTAAALTLGAGLLAALSFAGLVTQLARPAAVGGAVLVGVDRDQVERTARLAREAAVTTPTRETGTANPPAQDLSTAYAEMRKQLSYCESGAASAAVERIRPGAYGAVFGLGAGVLAQPDERATAIVGDNNRTRALGAYLAAAYFGAATTLGFSGGSTGAPGQPSEAAALGQFIHSEPFRDAYRRLGRNAIEGYVTEDKSGSTEQNVTQVDVLTKARGGGAY